VYAVTEASPVTMHEVVSEVHERASGEDVGEVVTV
jgi:hypothetical protein